MSTNQNTQLINVFNKGMNTDTSDAYMPTDLYRHAENLRFFTNDGENSGELRLIEGYDDVSGFFGLNGETEIKCVCSIRNYIALLVNVQKDLKKVAEIWVYNTISEYKSVPFSAEDDFVWEAVHYSTVTRWEDQNNVKLYIADGIHLIMSINIAQKLDGSPVETRTSLMYNILSNTYKFGGFLSVTKRTGGLLRPAIVLYAYILYNHTGAASNISPSTHPINLCNVDDGMDIGVLYSQDGDDPTNNSIELYINETVGKYDHIKLYRITYRVVGEEPIVELIHDERLHLSEPFWYIDRGGRPQETETFAEFVSKDVINLVPNYIESKGDYLFAANDSYYKKDDIWNAYLGWDATAQNESDGYLDFSKPYDDSFNSFLGHNIKWEFVFNSAEITTNTHDRSLRRNEVYRYGIVLYDIYGGKWPVKWIADIRTPSYNILEKIAVHRDSKWYANNLGIGFTVSNLPETFSNFEIVRCNRGASDRLTISQGIIGRAMSNDVDKIYGREITSYYPSGFLTMGRVFASSYDKPLTGNLSADSDKNFTQASTDGGELILFASPEVCYLDEHISDRLGNTGKGFIIEPIAAYATNSSTTIEPIYYPADEPASISRVENQTILRYGEYGFPIWYHGFIPDTSVQQNMPKYFEILSGTYFQNRGNLPVNERQNTAYETRFTHLNDIKATKNKELPNIQEMIVSGYTITGSSEHPTPGPVNSFANESKDLTYADSNVLVDTISYTNWSVAMLLAGKDVSSNLKPYLKGEVYYMGSGNAWVYVYEAWAFGYPIGTSGKCALIRLQDKLTVDYNIDADQIIVANLRSNNTTPYGGYSEFSRKNSIYSSYGYYFSRDDQNIRKDIYDGDCYIQNFYYNALHSWFDETYKEATLMSTVYTVPIETDIDINSDSGSSYKRNKSKYIQDEPTNVYGWPYALQYPAYLYNSAYSSNPTLKIVSGVSNEDLENTEFDYRIHFSNPKSNDEEEDSWLRFNAGDTIDVDTRYGEITGLRNFKNTLVFWQKDATGVLTVDEKTILQDVNTTDIILGNSGIIKRFDYITTKYGMAAHQMCDAQSDSTLYWWDYNNKEIVAYAGGQLVLPLKQAKTVSNYININTNSQKPILAYDLKYKELLVSVVLNDSAENKVYPIVYNEMLQQFTSIYNVEFLYKANTDDQLWLMNSDHAYKWNKHGVDLYPKLKYVISLSSANVKVYDNTQIGMGERFYFDSFYNGDNEENRYSQPLTFKFSTPLKQSAELNKNITNREYDLRFAIPRDNNAEYGGRLRGRTMLCELTSTSSSQAFSLQYIITKYRISYS